VKADECHARTSGVVSVWMTFGLVGLLMSHSWPTLRHAAAASLRGVSK
jgi:hypothetical protein